MSAEQDPARDLLAEIAGLIEERNRLRSQVQHTLERLYEASNDHLDSLLALETAARALVEHWQRTVMGWQLEPLEIALAVAVESLPEVGTDD